LPPKLHEQQIIYTLRNFYHYRDQLPALRQYCSSQFSFIVYQSAILPLFVPS